MEKGFTGIYIRAIKCQNSIIQIGRDKWRETRKRKRDFNTESSSIRFHKNFKFHRMLKPSDFLEVLVEKWNQPPNTNTPRR